MTDRLDRIIAEAGTIFAVACDTTELVGEARRRHDLGPTAAAALGRAITANILLAGLLKDDQNIQLTFEGNGPLGKVVTQAGASGWCRGYVHSPHADVPLKNGLIDVAGGIGRAGFLRVVKDIGLKEKYTGLTRLYTSEIGEDIAYYLTESEQTPSTIHVGIHLQADGVVTAAGGYLVQTLPPSDEGILRTLENNSREHQSISRLLADGATPLDLLKMVFKDIPHKFTGSTNIFFRCSCSREKMEGVLETLGREDIDYLLEQDDGVAVTCDYCSENYLFTREFLLSLAARKNLH